MAGAATFTHLRFLKTEGSTFVDKKKLMPSSPESLQQLVESVKNPAANAGALPSPSTGKDDRNWPARDKKVSHSVAIRGEYSSVEVIEPDASTFQKQNGIWYGICELPAGNEAPCTKFVLQLHQNGLLRGDDISDRFFRVLLEISVSHFAEVMQSSQQVQSSFLAIDIYSKLVYLILKILAVAVRSIQKDHDEKKEEFNPRPYSRLFINWLSDFSSLDPVHEGVSFQVFSAFGNAFHALQHLRVPAFSFAWLELVSHSFQMSLAPRILSEVAATLKAKQMKADVDEYFRTREQRSPFLSELKQRLLLPPKEAALARTRYSVPLINSLVLYVGMQAIQLLQSRNRTQPQSMSSDHLSA